MTRPVRLHVRNYAADGRPLPHADFTLDLNPDGHPLDPACVCPVRPIDDGDLAGGWSSTLSYDCPVHWVFA